MTGLSFLTQNFIKDHINLSDYDNLKSENEVINVYNIFCSEYGFEIKRKGEKEAFKNWLMGLPTVLSIPFYYWDINKVLIDTFQLKDRANFSDSENSDFYFDHIANEFFFLLDIEKQDIHYKSMIEKTDIECFKKVLKTFKHMFFDVCGPIDNHYLSYAKNGNLLDIHSHNEKRFFINFTGRKNVAFRDTVKSQIDVIRQLYLIEKHL